MSSKTPTSNSKSRNAPINNPRSSKRARFTNSTLDPLMKSNKDFWKWLYQNNIEKPTFDRKSDVYLQFDPQGITPIIQKWLKSISMELYSAFPPSLQQIIIYFVLHFEFQTNNPMFDTTADFVKNEFSARVCGFVFGTILFGKAFPSSTRALFTYKCIVKINNRGYGIGIGVVPHDFNTFLHDHEYFPHDKPNTCVMLENGQYYDWNGIKHDSEFRIAQNDTIIVEMNMKTKIMTLKSNNNNQSFQINGLPNESRLAFVLDGAHITVTLQQWKL
eukprot:127452_1